MHYLKLFSLALLVSCVQPSYCMLEGSREESSHERSVDPNNNNQENNRKAIISFFTKATITVGLKNAMAKQLDKIKHPLVENLYDKPYSLGNGGLLNPELQRYESKSEVFHDIDCAGVYITVCGTVATDGIAPYEFHKKREDENVFLIRNAINTRSNPTLSKLEEAIVGFLKERAADEERCSVPNRKATFFADRFQQFIKDELTSKKLNERDTGVRTVMEDELMCRHMTQSNYWPDQRSNPHNFRIGEYIRLNCLNGNSDSLAAIELNQFDISVEVPDTLSENTREKEMSDDVSFDDVMRAIALQRSTNGEPPCCIQ